MPTESAESQSEPEDWFVFETFGADGTLVIGAARGTPDPSAVMVVQDGLTRRAAREVASRVAAEYREAGRSMDSSMDDREMRIDLGDA